MKKNKISVLMGIYNCADTLPKAIECIQQQTYSNWQLILCDDGSSDATYAVAQKYADQDPRIVLIKNEKNQGLNKTLNRCFEYADGEYIARMDGDDTCSPERFEKEVSFLQNHPEYALVSCQMTMFDRNGTFRMIHYDENPTKKQLIRAPQFCHAGCMMRSDVFRMLGGYTERPDRLRVEDFDLWVRLYAKGYKGYNIQEPLYAMRDDRNAAKRRSFQNRRNESRVIRQAGFLFHHPVYGCLQSLIPLAKWCVPTFLYNLMHRYHTS